MENKDVRWKQRFANYKKALAKLSEAVEEYNEGAVRDIVKEGMIQRFEYTYELAWNTIKDYYEEQGETNIQGSKDAIKLAYNRKLISNGETWFSMVDSRKLTVHTYNEDTANEVAEDIAAVYHDLFIKLQTRLEVDYLS
ncbi:nucleotidyltransferase substrate binding protein [Daejeonella sp.]|uniref:nucleotidyltransferase substrate binding protein n=1 Tax=Daejeonella sp. TaxID=2805397 RepID=UPI0030C1153B